jgi:hypothetical protein
VTEDGPFSRDALASTGFTGWVRFADLEPALHDIPTVVAGIYVVLRERGAEPPAWVTPSPVGLTWRGDPSVSIEQLEANWVPGAQVVYVGKAKSRRLRSRLRGYLRYGEGRGGRHAGGRLIWQLPDPWTLRVAWQVLPAAANALAVEGELIAAFRSVYGKPPFANAPHMWGR